MKVLILQDDLYAYLVHTVRAYASGGIDPEEGLALYQLSQALKSAQSVDENQVAKIATGEIAETPVAAVSVEPVESRGREPKGLTRAAIV